MPYYFKSNLIMIKCILRTLIISLFIFSSNIALAKNSNLNIEHVYELLQGKKFKEAVEQLDILSSKNDIKAQLLYSKILFSGDIIPQNFEKSYFWASSSFLGGIKNATKIIDKLDNYLTEKQIESIKKKLKLFFEERVFNKDKKAIIQIAKFYESYIIPPEMINAYTWYNIAVANGIKTAKNKRNETLSELNQKDLLEAQTLSIKLFKQINN